MSISLPQALGTSQVTYIMGTVSITGTTENTTNSRTEHFRKGGREKLTRSFVFYEFETIFWSSFRAHFLCQVKNMPKAESLGVFFILSNDSFSDNFLPVHCAFNID